MTSKIPSPLRWPHEAVLSSPVWVDFGMHAAWMLEERTRTRFQESVAAQCDLTDYELSASTTYSDWLARLELRLVVSCAAASCGALADRFGDEVVPTEGPPSLADVSDDMLASLVSRLNQEGFAFTRQDSKPRISPSVPGFIGAAAAIVESRDARVVVELGLREIRTRRSSPSQREWEW